MVFNLASVKLLTKLRNPGNTANIQHKKLDL
jgi:hypothetical protein